MTKLQMIAEWYSFIIFALSFIGVASRIVEENKIEGYISAAFVIIGFLLYLNIFLSRWFG